MDVSEERTIKAGWAVVLGEGVVIVEGLTPEPITLSPREARVFRDHTWSAYPEGGNDGYAVEGAHSGEPGCIVGDKAMATHVARHDPARVLREVKAKRQLLDEHVDDHGRCDVCADPPQYDATWRPYPCTTVRLLALPYSDHPEYQEAWRP